MNARGLAEIYQAMGYIGVAVGRFDLLQGLDFLVELEQQGYPLLSANLYVADNPVFKPFKSVVVGGKKICLIGITAAPDTDKYRVLDPTETLNKLLPEVTPTHDIVVILSNASHEVTKGLAESFPQPHIFIGGDHRKGTVEPIVINNSLLIQVDALGQRLGVLVIDWNGSPWQPDVTRQLEALKNRLKNAKWQQERMAAVADKSSERYAKRKIVVDRNVEALTTEIGVLEQSIDPVPATPRSSYISEMIDLDHTVPVDRKIQAMVLKLKEEKNRARLTP